MLVTPILFLIFKRLDITVQVFHEIRKQRPNKLFIAGDGGRTPEEHNKCIETREAVLSMINWDCEVKTLFRDNNLGCRDGVSGAISWFFRNVEEGIIIEEDCLPDASFFDFCAKMLNKYRDNSKIMSIVGTNFQDGTVRGDGDYYFSYMADCWGWATWKRAWNCYDKDMTSYNKFKLKNILWDIYENNDIANFWETTLDHVYNKKLSSWASIWTYSVYLRNGLTIYPNMNLISNIGFNNESTHCADPNSSIANRERFSITITKDPTGIEPDVEADVYTYKTYMGIEETKLPIIKYMIRHPLFVFRKKFWKVYVLDSNSKCNT